MFQGGFMSKKIICAFLLAAILLITACRGQRSIKVNIIYPNQAWYGWMVSDTSGNTLNLSGLPQVVIPPGISPYFPGGATISQNFDTKTINLGDVNPHIILWVLRITQPANGSQKLEVNITEDYTAGFLYPATSDVRVDSSNNTNNIYLPVYIDYDFGNIKNQK
jgi:hypothetical protein